jgi:dTDP-4-amino-4,6-dideoxygalactose transaminase
MLTIYPYFKNYKPKRYKNTERSVLKYLEDYYRSKVSLINSGRVGLYLGLQYNNFSGARENHVLVPKYISSCVLNILNKNSFPVRKLDDQTKAVLVFHQWGYPQKMDEVLALAKAKKLIVVEDCANSFGSRYKNQLTGTFGDFAIFSFPKIFSSFTGGMLLSNNEKLIEKMEQYKKEKDQPLANVFQKICFFVVKRNSLTNKNFLNHDLNSICYSKYASVVKMDSQALRLLPLDKENFEKILNIRRSNFNYIKKNINPVLYRNGLEENSEIIPFAVPIFADEKYLEKIKNNLRQKNILADILHFDVNRNIFNPNYQKCLALPCHHLLKTEDLQTMVEIINKTVK